MKNGKGKFYRLVVRKRVENVIDDCISVTELANALGVVHSCACRYLTWFPDLKDRLKNNHSNYISKIEKENEVKIAELLIYGYSVKDISEKLKISVRRLDQLIKKDTKLAAIKVQSEKKFIKIMVEDGKFIDQISSELSLPLSVVKDRVADIYAEDLKMWEI